MSRSRSYQVRHSQNFLHSRALVAALIDRTTIDPTDTVLEIGPGDGIVTDALAQRSRHVLCVEIDPLYAARVSRRVEGRANVTVFPGDFLTFPLPATPYKVFANIPYRITAAIVARLTSGVSPPVDVWITAQREAADRFTGWGGNTMQSVRLAPWFETTVEHRFRRQDFTPRPSVDSVLLRLHRRDAPEVPWPLRDRYTQMVEAVFAAWRPTVGDALGALLPRSVAASTGRALGDGLDAPPSRMTPGDWVDLFRTLDALGDDRVWRGFADASDRLHRQQAGLDRPTQTRVHRPARPDRR